MKRCINCGKLLDKKWHKKYDAVVCSLFCARMNMMKMMLHSFQKMTLPQRGKQD